MLTHLTPARTEALASDLRQLRALVVARQEGTAFELGYLRGMLAQLVGDLAGVQATVLVNAALHHQPTAEEAAAALAEHKRLLSTFAERAAA